MLIIGARAREPDAGQIIKTRYICSLNSESIINQTKRFATKKWTNSIISQVGIAFHFKKD
ncbi:MAG: hypothetical protein ACJAQ2_000191 [Vicingaceae bacterium]